MEHGLPAGRNAGSQTGGRGSRHRSFVSSSPACTGGRASQRGHSLVLGPWHWHDPRRDRQHHHLGVPGLHHLRFGRSGWQQPQERSIITYKLFRTVRRSSLRAWKNLLPKSPPNRSFSCALSHAELPMLPYEYAKSEMCTLFAVYRLLGNAQKT